MIEYALIGRDGDGVWHTITVATGERGKRDLMLTRALFTARTDRQRRTIGVANRRTKGDRHTLPTGTLRAFQVVIHSAPLGAILADADLIPA